MRVDNNLTQKELAEVLKVSHTTIYHWEKGEQQPSLEMLARIALYFQASTDYLLGLKDF